MREMRDLLRDIYYLQLNIKACESLMGRHRYRIMHRYNHIDLDELYDLYDIDVYLTQPKKYCKDIIIIDIEEISKRSGRQKTW